MQAYTVKFQIVIPLRTFTRMYHTQFQHAEFVTTTKQSIGTLPAKANEAERKKRIKI